MIVLIDNRLRIFGSIAGRRAEASFVNTNKYCIGVKKSERLGKY